MYTARGPTDKIQNKNKTLAQSKKNLKFDFEKDILKLTYIFFTGLDERIPETPAFAAVL